MIFVGEQVIEPLGKSGSISIPQISASAEAPFFMVLIFFAILFIFFVLLKSILIPFRLGPIEFIVVIVDSHRFPAGLERASHHIIIWDALELEFFDVF